MGKTRKRRFKKQVERMCEGRKKSQQKKEEIKKQQIEKQEIEDRKAISEIKLDHEEIVCGCSIDPELAEIVNENNS